MRAGTSPAAASWFGVGWSARDESSRPSSSTSASGAESAPSITSASAGSGTAASESSAERGAGTLGTSPTPIVYRQGLPVVPAGHVASSPHAVANVARNKAASRDPRRVARGACKTKGRCNEGLVPVHPRTLERVGGLSRRLRGRAERARRAMAGGGEAILSRTARTFRACWPRTIGGPPVVVNGLPVAAMVEARACPCPSPPPPPPI